MPLRRSGAARPVAILGLLLTVVLAACGGAATATSTQIAQPTAETTATPALPAEPTPPASTGAGDLTAAATALENLGSYQFAIGISGDLGVPGMTPGAIMTMSGTVVLKPDRALQFSISGLTGSTAITYIVIGEDAWMDFGAGTYIQVPADQANAESLFETFQPETLLGSTFGSDLGGVLLAGEEEKNGVTALHYRRDANSPGGAVYGPDGAADIWVAKDGGFLVSAVIKGSQLKAGVAVPFDVSMDFSHFDDPANTIEPPQT